MALPLKTGADLYNQQLIRARLQNLGAQPNTADVGLGQVYFNTGTNTAASLRIGYCYETGSVPKFHHVANLEDVNRLEELISALSGSSSESVASVLGRVITLEGYFSNGKAKDADLLDGHNSDYFAEAATLNDLLEDYEAFKAVFSDNSDDYINTWTEVKAFLDGIKNTEDLNAILLGINTELGKKADKATTLAGYGITDGIKYVNGIDLANGVPHNEAGYGYNQYGWKANGPALSIGTDGYLMLLQASTSDGQLYRRYIGGDYKGAWYKILDDNNYASVLDTRYLQLTGGIISNTSNAPLKIKTDSESAWVGIEYLNNLGEREGSIGVYGGKPIFVPAALDKIWTILHSGNYSDLITDLNKNLNVPSITIGGIKLSVVEGQLQIDGDAFATGQLSSGGIGSEGSGSGASGIVILEDWEKYDDTLAQVLGAGLGVGLRDKIAALESKATNVSVAQTLTSGKEIGAITIDGVATKLFAPDDYLPLSGGTLTGDLYFQDSFIRLDMGKTGRSRISNIYGDEEVNALAFTFTGLYIKSPHLVYVDTTGTNYSLLHEGNYESIVGNKFLKLSGGTIQNLTGNMCPLYLLGNDTYVALGLSIGKNQPQAYLAYDGRELRYAKPDASWNTLLHEGNYAATLDNAYLKLSGGTLSGTLDMTRESGAKSHKIKFSDWHWEGFLYQETGELRWGHYVDDTTKNHTILHSGNFNTYAPTLTGVGASGTWGIDISGRARGLYKVALEENFDLNTKLSGGGIVSNYASASYFVNKPSGFTYGSILQIASAYLATSGHQPNRLSGQLAWDINHGSTTNTTKHLWWRATGDGSYEYSNWRQIAFTDSDITGNAASATKLQTARSLWGNKFDGTADINTNLKFNANDTALSSWKKDGSSVSIFLQVNPDRHVLIGQGTARENGGLYLYGNDIRMCYGNAGSSNNTAMLINSSGNVTIGNNDYAGSDYRLYVNAGRVRFASVAGEAPTLGTMSNMAVAVGLAEYGMQSYVLGNGNAHIQVGRFDGNANAYSLCLNPLGGNVGIGTADPKYKLEVHGTIKHYNNENNLKLYTKISDCNIQVGRTTSAYTGGYNCGLSVGEDDKALTYLAGAYVNGVGTTGIQYFYGGTGAGEAAICISDNIGIVLNKKITTYSRLLVNGATDNGSTGLQVIGGAHIQGDIANHLSNILTSGTGTWAKGHYAVNSSGARLGGFGFLVGENSYLSYLFLGLYGNEWLKINAYESIFEVSAKFNAGALIPSGQTLKIGDAVLSWDSTANALKVNKNFYSDGQVSSGGVAEEGTGGVGGSALDRLVFEIPANTTSFPCEHGLGTRDISVTIYEKGNDFQQVLADVYLDSTNVARIVFGSATDVAHKVVIIG